MNKAQWDFPGCIHCLWETYRARRHSAVRKFCRQQSVHRRVVDYHERHSKSYTKCTRHYGTFQNVYTACGRCTGPAAMELYSAAQWVYKSSVGGRVFTAEWCIAMRLVPSRTPREQGTAGFPRMCTQPIGDEPGPPPFLCTGPYNGCTKIPLAAECSPLSGALP